MKPLFVVGYMGCGKTTFGEALAKVTGKSFIDLDQYIEKYKEKTVKQIFQENGEDAFRKIESDLLRIASEEADIIACGGGTPCFYGNIEYINQTGISVWLDASIEVLLARLKVGNEKRPLLRGLSENEIANKIESQLSERRKFYSKAKIHWNGDRLEDEEMIMENILSFISKYPELGFAITNPLV